jgi:hypothetical protein
MVLSSTRSLVPSMINHKLRWWGRPSRSPRLLLPSSTRSTAMRRAHHRLLPLASADCTGFFDTVPSLSRSLRSAGLAFAWGASNHSGSGKIKTVHHLGVRHHPGRLLLEPFGLHRDEQPLEAVEVVRVHGLAPWAARRVEVGEHRRGLELCALVQLGQPRDELLAGASTSSFFPPRSSSRTSPNRPRCSWTLPAQACPRRGLLLC